jgi:VCBS repeat-containing protein
MRRRCLFLLALALLAVPAVVQATNPLGVQAELDNAGWTYVDMVRTSGWWLDAATWQALPLDQVDSDGWPLVDAVLVNDIRLVAHWEGSIDDPENYMRDFSGTYLGSFTGQGVVISGDEFADFTVTQSYESGTNTTSFDVAVPQGANGFFWILIIDSQRTPTSPLNSGFTNLRVTVPGYNHDTTQVLTDDFVDCVGAADFTTVRYMRFNYPWDSELPEEATYPDTIAWSERSLPTDAMGTQMAGMRYESAPWEHTIAAANATGKDMWLCIPVSASTDYVTQLATLVKNNLDSGLNVYVENANEVWNSLSGVDASDYNEAQAQALGLTAEQNYARRTVELCDIFAGVFGASAINTRVRPMICWHFPLLSAVQTMLNWINDNHGAPNTKIYGIASQTYFGGMGAKGQRGTRRWTVAQILDGCMSDIDDQLSDRQAWLSTAGSWSLPGGYMSYEGGPDFGGGGTTNIANRILANRDVGMKDVYKYNLLDNWYDLGCGMAVQYNLSSGYNRYGCWGLTDDLAVPDRNHKFQAARDVIADSANQPPVANDDSYSTGVDETLNVEAPGVLGNDTDPNQDPLTAIKVSDPSHGSVTLNTDGSFEYIPDTGYEGIDTFTYKANDGEFDSNTATVTINVTAGGGTMHVDSITVTIVPVAGPRSKAVAEVVIVDSVGAPVENATVSGTFTGDITDTGSDDTDANGLAVIESGAGNNVTSVTFCVDSVTHATLTYEPGDNVETCDTN